MNIILAEEFRYPIGSFIDRVKQTFPPTSIISANSKNYPEVLKIIANAPALSGGWLVVCNFRQIPPEFCQKVDSVKNTLLYVVRNVESKQEFYNVLVDYDPNVEIVDNLNPGKDLLVQYVCENLPIDEKVATYLVNRHNGYVTGIAESVEILRALPKVTRDSIRKYTTKSSDISYDKLFRYIIGQPDYPTPGKWGLKFASHKSVVLLIRKYRLGIKYVMKFLVKRFEEYLRVYDLALDGYISLENYKELKMSNDIRVKDIPEHIVKWALEAIGVVSYDTLVSLYLVYKRDLNNGPTVGSVLTLLRLSKREEK